MWLYNLTFLLVVLATAVHCKPNHSSESDDVEENLEWPEKYSFEITKYDIASGLVEDIKVWKTDDESRVEYNHGAVKSFVTKGKGHKRGYRYEIHPETNGEDEVNEVVCHTSRRSRWDSGTEDILPATDDFELIGKEMMGNEECSKFFNQNTYGQIENKETLWAFYDESAKAFVPVRYEVVQYNNWLGNVDRHDLWDFENFNDDFDEKEIFDTSELCDRREPIHHDMHDEAVTKHLMFISPDNKDHVEHVFKAFKKNFNKNYANEDEHAMRKSILQRNMRLIKSRNRMNLGYKLAVNKFSDQTPKEMKRHMGLLPRPEGKKGLTFPYDSEKLGQVSQDLPKEYDLRLEGIISPVLNQESCGSCWTFGTTAAVEGALARYNGGKLITLSNQALIDCAWEFGASGCDGGTDNAAYEWMQKYGLPKVSEYGTYKNQDGYCHIANMTETYPIKGFVDVTPNSVQALKVALVNHGPLSVSVDATDAFVSYSGGVFYDFTCTPTSLNHEITLVGYGEEYGDAFWIVKNSWGQEWGIDGYMHISVKNNNCGIMTEPTYVLF